VWHVGKAQISEFYTDCNIISSANKSPSCDVQRGCDTDALLPTKIPS